MIVACYFEDEDFINYLYMTDYNMKMMLTCYSISNKNPANTSILLKVKFKCMTLILYQSICTLYFVLFIT